jgi:hypothetical protein
MQPLAPFSSIPSNARNPDGSVNGEAVLPWALETLEIGGQCRVRVDGLQGAVKAMQSPK